MVAKLIEIVQRV